MPAYFWPQTGGIETITLALAREWVTHGHDVTVLTSKGAQKPHEVLDNIRIIRTGKYAILGCPLAPGALLRIAKTQPNVVYLHYPHPLFLDVGMIGALLAGVPYILHVHGPEIAYDDWRNFPISCYNKTAFRFALSHAAAIVSHTKAAVDSSHILSAYKEKITIIPHGTTKPPVVKVLPPKEKSVLFVGMLRDYKRVDLLLRAFVFVAHYTPAKLFIVGDGPLQSELQQLAKELHLANSVVFIGHVSEQEKWAYYRAADVFVLPSPTLMESFGTVALEAASCGKPVIVTGAGVAEVFRKEGIGVVAEPYNVHDLAAKIIDLLEHPTKARKIGRASASVITKKYLWKTIAPHYLELFEQVTHGNLS